MQYSFTQNGLEIPETVRPAKTIPYVSFTSKVHKHIIRDMKFYMGIYGSPKLRHLRCAVNVNGHYTIYYLHMAPRTDGFIDYLFYVNNTLVRAFSQWFGI
jgi:hypothetical protein